MRKSSGLSASSRCRTLDRSVRTISRLRIEGTTKCSRIPVVSDLAAIWGLLPSEVASAPTRLMAEISQPTDPAATGWRKQTKLAHHPNIVPIRKVLSDLAIEHPIHVDVLNLESATRGLHTHEHSAIDWKA